MHDSVTAIIFVASLVGYDRLVVGEDMKQMDDSIQAFKDVFNNQLLHKLPIIFMMNKKDLLLKRTQEPGFELRWSPSRTETYRQLRSKKKEAMPANETWDEYKCAVEFIKNAYFENLDQMKRPAPIFFHETHATDIESMKLVLEAVKFSVVMREMNSLGLGLV